MPKILLFYWFCFCFRCMYACIHVWFVHIQQMTQNLLITKTDAFVALPPGEIRPPCKLIDRTHHVTEKVTQVSRDEWIQLSQLFIYILAFVAPKFGATQLQNHHNLTRNWSSLLNPDRRVQSKWTKWPCIDAVLVVYPGLSYIGSRLTCNWYLPCHIAAATAFITHMYIYSSGHVFTSIFIDTLLYGHIFRRHSCTMLEAPHSSEDLVLSDRLS